MDDYVERRDELVKSVERSEQELRRAVDDLTHAVSRPLHVIEQATRQPLPWIISGILIGVWLGARDGNGNGHG